MTLHLVSKDGTSLCPEALKRDAMDEGEFWEWVFNRHAPEVDFDDGGWDVEDSSVADPCPVCGSPAECGYDTLGRPLIHVTQDDDR